MNKILNNRVGTRYIILVSNDSAGSRALVLEGIMIEDFNLKS